MSFPTVRLFFLGCAATAMLLFPGDGLRALGLGEARVDSFLGQRLDMSVRLLSTEADTLEGMTVSLASTADFERLGLPTEALALGLEASLDRRSDPPRIHVTSRNPVRDPIIQLLLDARWANGRVLREYTLFLDPPTSPATPPVRRAPAETPAADAAAAVRAEPGTRPDPVREVPTGDDRRTAPVGDTFTVQRGDTLWSIAYNWRPDDSLTMSQVLLAIFEQNRHAFMDENINWLASGAQLRMPTIESVHSVQADEATQQVQAHMQAWQQPVSDRDLVQVSDAGVPEEEPARTREAQATPSGIVHRLDVVPAEEDDFAGAGVVDEAEIRQVEDAVVAVEEQLRSEHLESTEFDQRISEIRDALATREAAGLAVAEEGLAEMESRLRDARRARDEAEMDSEAVAAYFDDPEGQMTDEPVADEWAADAVNDVEIGADFPQEAEPAGVDVADREMPVATAPTTAQRSRAIWPWLLLGLVVILLAATAFWLLRRRSAEQALEAVTAGSDVERARQAVSRRPHDLAAHLALLGAFADRGDERGFSDALDEMYQQVDDENDAHWQEALGLAMAITPAHPLVESGREIASDQSDEDLERRADELLDMLDDQDFESAESDIGDDQADAREVASAPVEDAEFEDLAVQFEEDFQGDKKEADGPIITDEPERPLSKELVEPDEQAEDFSALGDADEPEDEAFEIAPDRSDELLTEGDEGVANDVADLGSEKASEEFDLDFEFTSATDPDQADDEFGALLGDDGLTGEYELTEDSDFEPGDAASDEAQEDRAQSDEDLAVPAEDESGATDRPEGTAELSDEDADVKLDLARAYVSVDLADSARTILEEVVSGGSPEKREEARRLLDGL